jgi:hypothetical protein
MDRLWDMIAKAPAIFATTDKFDELTPPAIISTALYIIDLCWQMDTELQSLYNALESSIPGPMYWPKLATMRTRADDHPDGRVFSVAYEFINLKMAMTLMLYWSTLTMLYNGLDLLYNSVIGKIPTTPEAAMELKDAHPLLAKGLPVCGSTCTCIGPGCLKFFDMTVLRPLTPETNYGIPGKHVLSSVEYCMQARMLDLGPSSIVTPVSIVIDTIKREPSLWRHVCWGKHALRSIESLLPYMTCIRQSRERQEKELALSQK